MPAKAEPAQTTISQQAATAALFPAVAAKSGMYESFYLRAVSPVEPVGVWIRYTVHKRPGEQAKGSLWFTAFDARQPGPVMCKQTSDGLHVPPQGWIAIDQAHFGPGRAEGACGQARWSLTFSCEEPELRHLPRRLMYRAPLPRTKLTSPAPAARFQGTVEFDGRTVELRSWPGMVGHNWGSEHAERWIWLHGIDFDGHPDAWLDVAIGRILIAGRSTPWVANGALSLAGRRLRLGGLTARGLRVAETAGGCTLRIPGERGLIVGAEVRNPPGAIAGWSYADPDGSSHDVINCSVAELTLELSGGETLPQRLHTAHGGAYELGMRERSHGVPIAPFPDG